MVFIQALVKVTAGHSDILAAQALWYLEGNSGRRTLMHGLVPSWKLSGGWWRLWTSVYSVGHLQWRRSGQSQDPKSSVKTWSKIKFSEDQGSSLGSQSTGWWEVCRRLLRKAPQNRSQSPLTASGAIVDKPWRRRKLKKLKGSESSVRVEGLTTTSCEHCFNRPQLQAWRSKGSDPQGKHPPAVPGLWCRKGTQLLLRGYQGKLTVWVDGTVRHFSL